MQIRDNLNSLKQDDAYSMALFALYKLQDVPEYAAISELAYILDKSNLLKLCENFGGCNITIPTISELENIVYALMLYNYTELDKLDFEEAMSKISDKVSDTRAVRTMYTKIFEILDNYNFYSGDK